MWGGTLEIWFQIEAQPDPNHRISIARIEPDGQAIPEITTSYPPYLAASLDRIRSYIERRLPKAEVRHLTTYPGTHHWMGATRMATSPADGCVDRTLRYFGLDNLYVLSASTFPSCSSANPTLTVAALALRLGDHLTQRPAQ
jgi:choline dehydrogenase-like flavoprotein